MATSGDQEGEEPRRFNLDELLKNWNESEDAEESDDETTPDKSEGVSMFCKACLNPYSGEPKAGTIVLKCERCGQTDVVLEEKAVDLDPEEWSGNLMMNRFLQVLKEQEDLQLNIVDPYFADDDYKHLVLAIQEYTFSMKTIAEKMYDIARQARIACESRRERKQESRKEFDAERQTDDRPDASQSEDQVEQTEENAEKENWMPFSTKKKLKRLGATVYKLMHSIVERHDLPSDTMDKVADRIRRITESKEKGEDEPGDATEADAQSISSDNGSADEVENIVEEGMGASMSADNVKDDTIKDSVLPKDEKEAGETENISGDMSASSNNGSSEKTENEKEENLDDDLEYNSDDETPGMVVSKEKIENEIFGVLKSKFSIKFENDNKEEEEGAGTSKENDNEEQEADKDGEGKDKTEVKVEYTPAAEKIRSQLADELEAIDSGKSDKEEEGEEVQVNFYSLSSAFIHELQCQKREALMARKDKALRIVHEKIVSLKQEVENVETRVHDELTNAYKKKLRKVENQRKQLDKRHETIQDVEQLMNHYARTGQNDKLTELMEQLNIQYEN